MKFNFFKSTKSELHDVDFVKFAFEYARKSKRDIAYRRVYRNIANHIKNFCASREIENMPSSKMDVSMMEDIVSYLKEAGLSMNTIASIMSKIRHLIRCAGKNYAVGDISEFANKTEHVRHVYLTSDEIKKIAELRILDKDIAKIRDVFIIGCMTGMRYSDYTRLTDENMEKDFICIKTKKTGAIVQIPASSLVKTILERHDGHFPSYKKSQANFNAVIKRIAKRAGITDDVLIERTVGGQLRRKNFKKYKLVSSHTARRSFATNAYLSGIPTFCIMLMTGHATESSFFKYIQISREENASILKNHIFFK